MEQLCNIALAQKGYEIKEAENCLQHFSSHVVRNAFHRITFGGDSRGIFGFSPTDMMHEAVDGSDVGTLASYIVSQQFPGSFPCQLAQHLQFDIL
jgi:hypothetical protein